MRWKKASNLPFLWVMASLIIIHVYKVHLQIIGMCPGKFCKLYFPQMHRYLIHLCFYFAKRLIFWQITAIMNEETRAEWLNIVHLPEVKRRVPVLRTGSVARSFVYFSASSIGVCHSINMVVISLFIRLELLCIWSVFAYLTFLTFLPAANYAKALQQVSEVWQQKKLYTRGVWKALFCFLSRLQILFFFFLTLDHIVLLALKPQILAQYLFDNLSGGDALYKAWVF